jgi:hypothetical protein
VLELAEFAVLAVATKMPVVAHLLARAFHTLIKRRGSSGVARWQWLIESLLVFVVISIFLLFVLCGRCNRDIAIRCSSGFPNSS